MANFTSALYLGLRHPATSLRPWRSFTTGAPAALTESPEASRVASELARMIGCQQGLLAPSTLHLFWDLFGLLARSRVAIFSDAGLYPIVRWGTERAKAQGVPVTVFPHFDPDSLNDRLRKSRLRDLRPVVVTDGFCPRCGHPAPLAEYLEAVRRYEGCLVIDDTQALGIFGTPQPLLPYGRGGGGTLRWTGVAGPDVIVGASLAKGFGVPIAVFAGSEPLMRWFEGHSETRMHCSPPPAVSILAAEHALAINRSRGDALRLRLAKLVIHFRRRLKRIGLPLHDGIFPVQALKDLDWLEAATLYRHLASEGLEAVLHPPGKGGRARLSFIITALHNVRQLDAAVIAIERYMCRNPEAMTGG